MSRLSQIFHNNAPSVTGCVPELPSSDKKPAPEEGKASEDIAQSQSDGVVNPRANLRELIQEVLKEIESNPACEGIRRELKKSEAQSHPIVHTIGSLLPTQLHDLLKDLVQRVHKVTRRCEPATTKPKPAAAESGDAEPSKGASFTACVAPSTKTPVAPPPAPAPPAVQETAST